MPRDLSLVSLLDPNWEYLNETIHNQFIFSLFRFVLQQSISDMTTKWSEIPAVEKIDLIELEMCLVISRSSQWPWTLVGKLTCCLKSEHVRISLNLLVFQFGLSRCNLKSPNIYKLSCSKIMFSSSSWNSSNNWHVLFWSLFRQTRKRLNELLPYVQRSLRTF